MSPTGSASAFRCRCPTPSYCRAYGRCHCRTSPRSSSARYGAGKPPRCCKRSSTNSNCAATGPAHQHLKRLEKRQSAGRVKAAMPLIKLSRINKGGEIVVNSDHILFIEVESRATTVHMMGNLLFSVEEPLDSIAVKIEMLETGRIKNAIQQSGLIPE